jgi:CopG family nickel-responsive transcriptional regulator
MNTPIERISLSLPGNLIKRLDALNQSRGFTNRSQAFAEIIQKHLSEHETVTGDPIMTGTITLVYQHSHHNLHKRLSDIQYAHIGEVISSLHVLLEEEYTMEVILVQGPASRLRSIADEMIRCKGVKSGNLKLIASILPPIHTKSEV